MSLKQISVFLENRPGSLADFTEMLARNGVDLVSLSVADTASFGILRGIAADHENALKIISAGGYTVKSTEVLAVSVPDRPGGLAEILSELSRAGVNVEYLYSFVRNSGSDANIIIRVDQVEMAEQVLSKSNVRLLSRQDVKVH